MARPKKTPKADTTASEPAEKLAAEAIKEIEPLASGRVLVYTSKRSLAFWDIPPLYALLEKMGHQEKLSVIIQSNGGFQDDAMKMANVIHEFADHVTFIVPFYAASAATMLCLSGNLILMGPTSYLGPTNPMMRVDKRLITPSMPEPAEGSGESKEREPPMRQMAAHALRDFLTASGVLRSDGKGYDPEVLSVYMAKGILNPFLLGEFERSNKMALQYTENLLATHMFGGQEDASSRAQEVARLLCEGYFDHAYPIGRKEAREKLRLEVGDMTGEMWTHSSRLMLSYDSMMESQNIATIIETSDGFEITHWAPE